MKTPDEIKKGLEALDKMQFFMGQRAGRELWMNKPHDVQEKDLESFNRDVEIVRGLIQQLERERDALAALYKPHGTCGSCKHNGSKICDNCINKDNHWEWAGIKEDNP